MAGNSRLIISVAVTLPVKDLYTYSVPDDLAPLVATGKRVTVPFKNRKIIGYIIEINKSTDGIPSEIKDISDVLDPSPLFTERLIPFFQWMSHYYLNPIGLIIQSALPGGINVKPYKSGLLTEKGTAAMKLLPPESNDKELLEWLKDNPQKRLPAPFHRFYRMAKMGWINFEDVKSSKGVGPLKRKFVKLREEKDIDSLLMDRYQDLRAMNEEEFLRSFAGSKEFPLKEIYSRFSNGSHLVKKWIKAGVLMSCSRTVFRDPSGKSIVSKPEPPFLYEQQEKVLKKIHGLLEKGGFAACLLNGVTGSGKTEVYYKAITHAIDMGKQALLLVPEIALAQYTEGLFRTRLGDRVAVFHSRLSRGEQYDQWMLMMNGKADLVIGARSALFAPLDRLGLIIIDEEYDSSYKQEENPRYQARDAAVARGRIENSLVILGAGTPSIQSYYNATNGRYHLLSMPERIEKRPLPDMEIVDMKSFSGRNIKERIMSPLLKKAIETNLNEEKQTILFLNRRGFSNVYLCRSCGESVKCPNCDLTLTYHLKVNNLFCHYCGYYVNPINKCAKCGHNGMRAFGFGTERLEQELGEIFPHARLGRLDRDSTRRKGEIYRILKSFSRNEMDILVGTQMLAKGYDFPNVTLVGVISADISLGFPDFRAGERTFQILSQVGGRAGRGIHRGKVIVQTFNPEHYAIVAARNHDYESFFSREKELREQLDYPPFSYLACLRFQGNNQKATEEIARKVGEQARSILAGWPKRGKEIQILGPAPAPLSKLRGKYRWQILVKSKGTELLHYFLNKVEDLTRGILRRSGVNMIIDIDPYQML